MHDNRNEIISLIFLTLWFLSVIFIGLFESYILFQQDCEFSLQSMDTAFSGLCVDSLLIECELPDANNNIEE